MGPPHRTVQEVVEHAGRIAEILKSKAGQRVVPLPDDLVLDLSRHLAGRARDGLVFTDPKGGPLDYSNWLKRVWAPALEVAELADLQPTPRDCPHSYGSWLAESNVPSHDIRDLMVHGSLRATERYVHASEKRMQRARDALGARRTHGAGGVAAIGETKKAP